jgi:hypothetical protein
MSVQSVETPKDTEVRRLGRFVASADAVTMTQDARDELRKRAWTALVSPSVRWTVSRSAIFVPTSTISAASPSQL